MENQAPKTLLSKVLTVFKWIGIVLVAIIGLAFAFIYGRSYYIFNKKYDIPLTEIQAPTDSASIAEGFRLTRIETCNGCHGPDLKGAVMHEDDMVGRLVSANITKVVKEYTDAELYRLLRHGVKKEGKIAFVMPAKIYYHLKEESILNIIAYLRTLEVLENDVPLPDMKLNIMPKAMLAFGQWKPDPADMDHQAPKRYPEHPDTPMALGEYIAHTTCAKCHGHDLQGEAFFKSPGLGVMVLYGRDQFYRLIRDGEGVARKDVGEMTAASKNHLKYFTDEEIDAVYTYLESEFKTNKVEASKLD